MDETRMVLFRVKSILIEVLELDATESDIGDDDLLFGGNLGIDSVAAVAILTGLEEDFGIHIEDEFLSAEVFANARSLAALVEEQRRRGGQVNGQIPGPG